MDRLRDKYQQAFCGAFFIGLATLGVFSHENFKPNDNLTVLKGSLQNAYEDTFSASNPLRQSSVNIWETIKYSFLKQASKGAIVGKDDWLFTTEELAHEAEHSTNLDTSIQEIVKIHTELQNLGITLLPVIVPDKTRIYAEKLKQTRNKDLTSRYGTLMSMLNEHKIATVTVLPPLLDHKSSADVFMRHDTHWSPFGAKVVADNIAQHIKPELLDTILVQTQHIGFETFEGDLLKYVPTGGLRPYIGPIESKIERFKTTVKSNASLFGDSLVDVVLVGTSFSAKSDWHFEGFLKQALSIDILNMSQEGKGPFVPMHDYLKSRTFKNSPPKLIIWEIPERYTTQGLEK